MTLEPLKDKLGKGLLPGTHHYRAFIGPPETYDAFAAMQFNLLTFLGLRENHFLLDIGCGSLRAGKLFIPYLLTGHYFGIEPEQWLIEEGIKNELGKDIINIKAPTFSNDSNFTCTIFSRKFDFILAQSIFTHAAPGQISQCMAQARECMKPTSIFAANFWQGNRNYAGNEWDYSTCITYTLERIVEFAREQGLICRPIDWPHPCLEQGLQWVLITSPESERHVQELIDSAKIHTLQGQLASYKERLAILEGHPYVKFGVMIYRIMKKIKPKFL